MKTSVSFELNSSNMVPIHQPLTTSTTMDDINHTTRFNELTGRLIE